MKIGARVEMRMAHQLRPEERAALKQVFRFTKKTRVMVSFSDRPDIGDFDPQVELSYVHELACLMPYRTPENPFKGCVCQKAEFGMGATIRIGRRSSRVVLRRFVPRPLRLEDALRYDEVDLVELSVGADTLLHQGHPMGERIALAVHAKRLEEV